MTRRLLRGPRHVLDQSDERYPQALRMSPRPPERLFVLGDPAALEAGLAVIGARKATPYGRSCAYHFATLAAQKGICIISGGARGCDSESHKAALACGGKTVVFLGGGIDCYYPAAHGQLFQDIVDSGGAIASEYTWDMPAMPYMFRERNRLIAGLAQAVLIVEAGLPSGTFSTADEALNAGKEVLVVPGSITSPTSRGSNRLLSQGATPIVDDDTFEQAMFGALCVLQWPDAPQDDGRGQTEAYLDEEPLLQAAIAQPLSMEALYGLAVRIYGPKAARARLNEAIAEGERRHLIARQADGNWGPVV